MKKLILLMMTLFALGCATTHPGNTGSFIGGQKDLGLNISALPVDDQDAGSAFQMFEITIENNSDDWLRIDKSTLVTDPAVSKVSVVVGNDLKSWAEAMALKKNMDNYNKDIGLAATTAVGTGLMIGGVVKDNKTVANIGAMTYLAGVTWAAADTISSYRSNSIGVKKVPESHIYESFAVPGKMFLRKWILVNKPSGLVMSNLVFQFETVSGEKAYYEVKL